MPFNGGYSYANAIQAVRDSTNSNFGQPLDAVIGRFLNRAVEQMCSKLDAPLVSLAVPITVPNTSNVTLPLDVWQLKSIIYSTGPINTPGSTPYEIVMLPEDEFIQNTTATNVGGVGGIPTVCTIIEDTENSMTLAFYPYVSTGFINFFYYQRGMLWDATDPNSVSNLDSVFQECVILWACAHTMHAREMDDRAATFLAEYKDALSEAKIASGKRKRKNQSITVRDVSAGASVWPSWVH